MVDDRPGLAPRTTAEFLGTAFLLMIVVGSGIMGDRLSGGNVAVALLANSVATAAGLAVLILVLGPVSGAHFNPVVTITSAAHRRFPPREIAPYVGAQVLGAIAGVMAAHAMFGEPLLQTSRHVRSSGALVLGEGIATFGLVVVIARVARLRPSAVPLAVGGWILAAYWFTSSTAFANPAVTLARALTDTFTGIRPADVPGFLLGETTGATAAALLTAWEWTPAERRRSL